MKRLTGSLKSVLHGCSALALAALPLYAQQQPAGWVTALQGQAQLTRSAASSPLRHKDGVIIRDIVDTREKSMTRILFGGRSTVTVRELSRLEVREELLPTGARRDVYELSSGGILVNVARQLMRSGDEVIIRTPNAVAAVRGTTVFVQYNAAANQSTIVVLSGTALVQGQLLGPNGRAIVSGTEVAFDTISQAEADQILNDSRITGLLTNEDSRGQFDLAMQLADTIVTITGGTTDGPPGGTDPPDTGIQGCLDCTTVSEAAAEIGGDSHGPPVFPLAPPGTLFIVNDSLTVPGNLFELPSGQNAEQPSPLLIATNAEIDIGSNGLVIEGSLTGPPSDPLFEIDPSTISTGDDLFHIGPTGSLSLSAPLLIDIGGTFFIDGDFLEIEGGGSLDSTSPSALVQFNSTTATITGDLFIATGGNLTFDGHSLLNLSNGANFTAGGSILDLTNSDLDLGEHALIQVSNESTLETTAGPVTKINGGSLIADSLVTTDGAANAFNLTGSVFDLTDATVSLRVIREVLAEGDSDTATFNLGANEPFIKMSDSTFNLIGEGEHLVSFGTDEGEPVAQTGVALIATGTAENPSAINVAGPVLDLGGVHLTDTNPQTQLTNTMVTQTGSSSIVQVFGLPVTVAGPLLKATDGAISTESSLLFLGSGTSLTGTSSDPLIEFNGSTISAGADAIAITGADSTIAVAGSLLKAGSTLHIGTNPNASGDVVDIYSGGQLVMNTADPVVEFAGGTHTIGTDEGSGDGTPNAIFRLQGVNTDVETGLGTDQVVKGDGIEPEPFDGAANPVGTLLKATGGATIEVKAGPNDTQSGGVFPGNAVRFDAMLFEAALPIIHLIGTGNTETTATQLATAGDSMDIFQSRVVSLGPVVDLDNGLIHVTNGAFITVRDGSLVDVTGDLLRLANGSKIEVINGPLIHVTGNSGTGSPSTLNVSGALVEFGGSGGNQIVVNNSLAVSAMRGGPSNDLFPVNLAGETSFISVGPDPIINPNLGSITVNGTGGQGTGALIQATSGGAVNIVAPSR